MSFLKKIGKAIGKVASFGSKVAGFIPGVGPLASGALGGIGAGLQGKNVLKGAAGGALGGLLGKVGGGLLGRIGAPMAGGQAFNPLTQNAAPAAGGLGGLLGRIGSGIAKDPLKAAQLGLAGANVLQSSAAQGRANKLNEQILQQSQMQQGNRNQLQQMVLARLASQQNPFGRYGRIQ